MTRDDLHDRYEAQENSEPFRLSHFRRTSFEQRSGLFTTVRLMENDGS
jgi:hypothetical protein